MNLPDNTEILYSYINTKLRDEFSSLESLCDYFDVSIESINEKLNNAGYVYDKKINKFIAK